MIRCHPGVRQCALVLGLIAGSVALGAAGPGDRAHAAAPAAATFADLSSAGDRTRFRLALSKKVDFAAFALGDPYRLIIDLPDVAFELPEGTGRRGEGLVTAYRFGLFAPGRSRIVIDVKQPFEVLKSELMTPASGKGLLLVVDIRPTDAKTFARSVEKPASGRTAATASITSVPKPQLADPRKARPVIVIDPGHGGIDSGAISPRGIKEKSIVLEFSQMLRDRLKATGRYKVIMTRDSDVFVTLGGRVDFAKEKGANLFVSIHADSVVDSRYARARGATVYTLSDKASDEAARRLALKENMSDILAGAELPEESDAVTNILMDLVQRETRIHSKTLAETVVGSLRETTELTPQPHRQAKFVVLKSPEVPSVLVELGFISNKQEVQELVSAAWRERVAAALEAAIDRYFERRVAKLPF